MKKHKKGWKKIAVHPMLHKHIMGSPILAPMAMPDEEAGEIPGQPDPDDALPGKIFGE